MTHPSPSEWELMRRHFSDERLRLYLTATKGDEDAAARLYQWNSRCSAAFWEALGYLLVTCRLAAISILPLTPDKPSVPTRSKNMRHHHRPRAQRT